MYEKENTTVRRNKPLMNLSELSNPPQGVGVSEINQAPHRLRDVERNKDHKLH